MQVVPDSPAIADLCIDAGLFPAEAIPFLNDMMTNYFKDNQAHGHGCLVDEENETLLGVAYYEPALATDQTWYLTMIAVRRSLQGQGRGAALMNAVETTHEEEARVRDYYAPGDDMILFRKLLSPI